MKVSVAGVQPAGVGAIARRHRFGWAVAVAFIGILAGASTALAVILPHSADEDFASPPTTEAPVVTTIPSEPGPPVVVPATDDDGTGPEDGFPEGGFPVEGVLAIEAYDQRTSATGWDVWNWGLPECFTEPGEITANQYFGTSSAATPYEKIYGTAPPGTVVTVVSDYGSADGTVGESGEYLIKVYFDDPPKNTTFPIFVTVGDHEFEFHFKWTPPTGVTMSQCVYPKVHDQRFQKVCGWAPAGTVIKITSAYGSVEKTVSGEYYVKIHFNESLPPSQWIDFTAKAYVDGELALTKVFEFKWVPETQEVSADQCVYPNPSPDPWQKICGWAPPGSVIDIISEHGSVEKAVSGEYYVKIHFDETLPPNQWIDFTVLIWNEGEVILEKVFEFKWAPPGGGEVTMERCVYPNPSPDPWQKICGWAPAGTVIDIISEHGSVEKAVSGEYHVKIHFDETLPPNEPITFTARAWIGGEIVEQQSFEFTWTPNFEETAHQKWGECGDAEPYDEFYGTAPPGTGVLVTSAYGTKTADAGWNGKWHAKIWFTDPPANTPFPVTVHVGEVTFDGFTFTWVQE
jgi:hypothetical protein